MTRIVLASRSQHKTREVENILAPLGVAVLSLDDVGAEPHPDEDAIEAYDTFRMNAVAKARWFAERLQRPVLADDSGLRVDALGGEPGVRTKRFSGRDDLQGEALDRANNRHLLERLAGIPDERRGARYLCCAVMALPAGPAIAAMGAVSGRIAEAGRGEGGFGYDPLFHVPDLDARFAEVPASLKNAMSHRARAFRALATAIVAAAPALT